MASGERRRVSYCEFAGRCVACDSRACTNLAILSSEPIGGAYAPSCDRLAQGSSPARPTTIPAASARTARSAPQFGYGLAWTFVLSFPLMVVIQQVAAEIGRVTGAGIARNLRRHYPRPVLWSMVALLLIANVVNLGADLSAMGAALVC